MVTDMVTDRTVEETHDAQLAEASEQARRWGELITVGAEKITDWAYQPPRDDDPETWKGVTRWAYCEAVYTWYVVRVTELQRTKAPYYCPACGGKKPAVGWRARKCVDCWWTETGYEESLTKARHLARGVLYQDKPWAHPYWWPSRPLRVARAAVASVS